MIDNIKLPADWYITKESQFFGWTANGDYFLLDENAKYYICKDLRAVKKVIKEKK